jgi:hypothetical protein
LEEKDQPVRGAVVLLAVMLLIGAAGCSKKSADTSPGSDQKASPAWN